jgi:hypothetical protein
MLVNYLIQAALVTFYAIVLLMDRLDFITSKTGQMSKTDHTSKLPRWMQPRWVLSRSMFAFSKSAKAFLNASILFSMAMLLAAMYVFGKRLSDHRTALAFLNQKWTFFYLRTQASQPSCWTFAFQTRCVVGVGDSLSGRCYGFSHLWTCCSGSPLLPIRVATKDRRREPTIETSRTRMSS